MPLYLHHPRLPAEHYVGRGVYFVTICCAERLPAFRDLAFGERSLTLLARAADEYSFLLHAFCLMPDHVHFLASGTTGSSDLQKFIHFFNQISSFDFKKTAAKPLWQGRFYEHIVRKTEDMQSVASYIWMNPVRKGICREPCEYPLSGPKTSEWLRGPAPTKAWEPVWKIVQKQRGVVGEKM